MNPPRKVKVGPLRFRIIVDQGAIEQCQARAGVADPIVGYCHPSAETIYLSPNQSPRTMRATLVHELFHALSFSTGMYQQYEARKVSEEDAIGGFDTGWLGVLRDNPKLVAWLTS